LNKLPEVQPNLSVTTETLKKGEALEELKRTPQEEALNASQEAKQNEELLREYNKL